MRRRLQVCATVLANYAVALHVILLGFAPIGVHAAAADPFSVICHSQDAAPGDQAPAKSGLLPGRACDHCNLCSASAPPLPPDVVLAAILAPARVVEVLRPQSTAPRLGIAHHPNLARGPPQPA